MTDIPGWIAAIGGLLVIASTLGAAVAVYQSTLTRTALTDARGTISDLRGEVTDYERREARLEVELERQAAQHASDKLLAEAESQSCRDRVKVLEDLLTKRTDDEAIRLEIAAVRSAIGDMHRALEGMRP